MCAHDNGRKKEAMRKIMANFDRNTNTNWGKEHHNQLRDPVKKVPLHKSLSGVITYNKNISICMVSEWLVRYRNVCTWQGQVMGGYVQKLWVIRQEH